MARREDDGGRGYGEGVAAGVGRTESYVAHGLNMRVLIQMPCLEAE